MNGVSILVADDHPILRRGIRTLLEPNTGWKVVAEVRDGREAVRRARELKPDVAILDISMPLLNGIESALQIGKCSPGTRMLILSMYDSEELVQKAVAAGVHGFVRKSEAEEELIAAVRAVLNDKVFFPSKASASLRNEYAGERNSVHSPLSPREKELLQLIAEGHTNKEVASIVGISRRTVENHRARIMHKLGLHSLSDLVRYALRHHIVAA